MTLFHHFKDTTGGSNFSLPICIPILLEERNHQSSLLHVNDFSLMASASNYFASINLLLLPHIVRVFRWYNCREAVWGEQF